MDTIKQLYENSKKFRAFFHLKGQDNSLKISRKAAKKIKKDRRIKTGGPMNKFIPVKLRLVNTGHNAVRINNSRVPAEGTISGRGSGQRGGTGCQTEGADCAGDI
jgi:hypothetical protein